MNSIDNTPPVEGNKCEWDVYQHKKYQWVSTVQPYRSCRMVNNLKKWLPEHSLKQQKIPPKNPQHIQCIAWKPCFKSAFRVESLHSSLDGTIQLSLDCLVQTDWWGGESGTVWGGITYHHQAVLHICHGRINAIYYRDNLFQNKYVIPFHQHQDMHTFQQ